MQGKVYQSRRLTIVEAPMDWTSYNYRYAQEILDSPAFQRVRDQIEDLCTRSEPIRRPPGSKFEFDQAAMNGWFDAEFKARGWEYHPYVIPDHSTKLQADFKKGVVQVEVQFGNAARPIYDLFKMQVAYSQGAVDLGVLILPVYDFARKIGDNIACFDRVTRELPYAKLSITLPIWIIGLSPAPLPKGGPVRPEHPAVEIPPMLRGRQATLLGDSPEESSDPSETSPSPSRSSRRSRRHGLGSRPS